jgi:hypothetical protein
VAKTKEKNQNVNYKAWYSVLKLAQKNCFKSKGEQGSDLSGWENFEKPAEVAKKNLIKVRKLLRKEFSSEELCKHISVCIDKLGKIQKKLTKKSFVETAEFIIEEAQDKINDVETFYRNEIYAQINALIRKEFTKDIKTKK